MATFEPVDVLDGAMELVDQEGTVIVINTDDPRPVDVNEYPKCGEGLYCEITHTAS